MFPRTSQADIRDKLVTDAKLFGECLCARAPGSWFIEFKNFTHLFFCKLMQMILFPTGNAIALASFFHFVVDIIDGRSLEKMIWGIARGIVARMKDIEFARVFTKNGERYAMNQVPAIGAWGMNLAIAFWKLAEWPFEASLRIAVRKYGSDKELKSGRILSWHLTPSNGVKCLASSFLAMGPSYSIPD
jgi:hypothetical protein